MTCGGEINVIVPINAGATTGRREGRRGGLEGEGGADSNGKQHQIENASKNRVERVFIGKWVASTSMRGENDDNLVWPPSLLDKCFAEMGAEAERYWLSESANQKRWN